VGPWWAQRTRSARAFSDPSARISTQPSGRFLTQPHTPRRRASRCVDARKETPCTRPRTTRCTCFCPIARPSPWHIMSKQARRSNSGRFDLPKGDEHARVRGRLTGHDPLVESRLVEPRAWSHSESANAPCICHDKLTRHTGTTNWTTLPWGGLRWRQVRFARMNHRAKTSPNVRRNLQPY
jgi:hypothetical protein